MITTPEEFKTKVADYTAELTAAYAQAKLDASENKDLTIYDKYRDTSYRKNLILTKWVTEAESFGQNQDIELILERLKDFREEYTGTRSNGWFSIDAEAYVYAESEAEVDDIFFTYKYLTYRPNLEPEELEAYAKKEIKRLFEAQLAKQEDKGMVNVPCEIMTLWFNGSIDLKTLTTIATGGCSV